jgi:hypothetical protein
MFLRRFLWFLSLSVFLAGLIYYFAGRAGASGGPAAETRLSGGIVAWSHGPDRSLVPEIVGRHSMFWYLTVADRAFIRGIVRETALASGSMPAEAWSPFRPGLGKD